MSRSPIHVLLAASLCALPAGAAISGGNRPVPDSIPAAYGQECGACHVAYPPGLLPAGSWRRIVGNLDRHYGTDASLDAATARDLGGWLETHAGTWKRAAEEPPQDRITRAAWFARKHRKVEAAVWQLPAVGSAANCAACHTGAGRGRFEDEDLRVPAGVTQRQRRAWND